MDRRAGPALTLTLTQTLTLARTLALVLTLTLTRCVCALLFGLVANSGLCCVLKCCWNPARSLRVAPADDNAGTMMQPLVPSAPEGEKPGSAGAPAPESGGPPKIPPPAVKGAWTE